MPRKPILFTEAQKVVLFDDNLTATMAQSRLRPMMAHPPSLTTVLRLRAKRHAFPNTKDFTTLDDVVLVIRGLDMLLCEWRVETTPDDFYCVSWRQP